MRKGQHHTKESLLKMKESQKRRRIDERFFKAYDFDDGPIIDLERKVSLWKRIMEWSRR